MKTFVAVILAQDPATIKAGEEPKVETMGVQAATEGQARQDVQRLFRVKYPGEHFCLLLMLPWPTVLVEIQKGEVAQCSATAGVTVAVVDYDTARHEAETRRVVADYMKRMGLQQVSPESVA